LKNSEIIEIRKKEEGRRKKEEGRRRKEEGRKLFEYAQESRAVP
jgi:hypothetical protein